MSRVRVLGRICHAVALLLVAALGSVPAPALYQPPRWGSVSDDETSRAAHCRVALDVGIGRRATMAG